MKIRLAKLRDVEAIRTVGIASWHDTYPGIVPDGYIPWALAKWWPPEEIQRQIKSSEYIVLVAEVAGQIVGIAHVQLKPDQSAILWRLYVAAALRGQGIGSKLIAEMERRLPAEVQIFYIDYFEKNHRAAAYYAKLGFEYAYRIEETFEDMPLVSVFVKRAVARKP